MATRKYSRRTARSSYSRRSTYRAGGRRRSTGRRSVSSRRSSQQTVRIVVEMPNQSAVARPEAIAEAIAASQAKPKKSRKTTF